MAYNAVAEELGVFFLKSESVVFFVLIPLFQFDDQVNGLGIFYGQCTKQCLDIHDADTTQFNKVFCDIYDDNNKVIDRIPVYVYNTGNNENVQLLDKVIECGDFFKYVTLNKHY